MILISLYDIVGWYHCTIIVVWLYVYDVIVWYHWYCVRLTYIFSQYVAIPWWNLEETKTKKTKQNTSPPCLDQGSNHLHHYFVHFIQLSLTVLPLLSPHIPWQGGGDSTHARAQKKRNGYIGKQRSKMFNCPILPYIALFLWKPQNEGATSTQIQPRHHWLHDELVSYPAASLEVSSHSPYWVQRGFRLAFCKSACFLRAVQCPEYVNIFWWFCLFV